MTPEYQSKLNDAFRMVMERIEKTDLEGDELDFLGRIKSNSVYLANSLCRSNMNAQKRDAEIIAAHAILYMVKFL